MDDLLPEKKHCSNSTTATTPTRTSYNIGGGVGTNTSGSNGNNMNKPPSKSNSTSIISQQPSNLTGNGNCVDVARKNSSGNSYIENELKVNIFLIKNG